MHQSKVSGFGSVGLLKLSSGAYGAMGISAHGPVGTRTKKFTVEA